MKSPDEKYRSNSDYWPGNAGGGPVPVNVKSDFASIDHTVLKFWSENDIFSRTISQREGCPDYVAYDGPPGTNGKPHIGNIMQSALKDLWPRFYTMKGFRVRRKAGWDTHGLPVEQTAERDLGLQTKADILEYGPEKYIDHCRSTVFRYKDEWTRAIRRIGRFLDTDDYYATLTPDYIQTGWWVLKQAWDKGLLYQGRKVLPYSPLSGTTLSAHEVSQGYKDITDISLYVKFPVVGRENMYFVAWTTTAWTLLSNVALAVNPNLIYVTVEIDGDKLILAEDRLAALDTKLGEYKVINKQSGEKLAGLEYEPLWSFIETAGEGAFRVISDEYVTASDGTGIVHLAMYGEDDYRIIQAHDLPMVQNVLMTGNCADNTGEYAGRYFREEGLDVDILKDLASRGQLLAKEKIVHSYPHNYKSGEPLMYFAKSAWFLRTSAFKEQMMKANDSINWYPEHIKHGRFGNWLENNIDWAISRERFWGTPLPIWTCEKCGEQVCVESLEELGKLRGEPLPADFDPHKPYIDEIVLPCGCGGSMKREPEVLDCWFDAGIMPWGQWGYPAKDDSADLFSDQYPGDFICEAIDQTRGWFYTMLAASTLLTNKSSFKNVICTELITDQDGRKMSKSLGNVVDPVELCERYGADAVRWNFYTVNPWTVRRFVENDIVDGLKQVIIPLWNAYSFFVTYARVDNWKPEQSSESSDRLLDRWLISRLEFLKEEVTGALDHYDVTAAASAITIFIDELTNWYIRRSRRRFWKSEDDQDKRVAYQTLHTVLCQLNRLLAPFMPFLSEVIYQNIERGYDSETPDSVHLTSWPEADTEKRDIDLERSMALTREIVTIARSLRNEGGLRIRQPLSRLILTLPQGVSLNDGMVELAAEELNIKRVEFITDPGRLIEFQAGVNFKVLGPRLGSRLKAVGEAVSELNHDELQKFISTGTIEVADETLTVDDILIEEVPKEGYWVRVNGDLTVAVDHRLTDELWEEWMARELVHQIQNLRKDAELQVTDRIRVDITAPDKLQAAIHRHTDYICNETLAVDIATSGNVTANEVKVGDETARIGICAV